MKTIRYCTLWIVTWLYGCGASDPHNETRVSADIPPPMPPPVFLDPNHFEGNWQGALTDNANGISSTAILLVNGWGEFRLVTEDMQFVGFPSRTATTVGGLIAGIRSANSTWSDGGRIQEFELSGSIDTDQFIDARYEGESDSGTLALAWATRDEPASLRQITGTWALYDQHRNIVATFQVGGGISGSHSNGCIYSGAVEAGWTSIYSYDITGFEVTGCPLINGIDLNGGYGGTAALFDIAGDESDALVLVVALGNGDNQLTLFLDEIP